MSCLGAKGREYSREEGLSDMSNGAHRSGELRTKVESWVLAKRRPLDTITNGLGDYLIRICFFMAD